ncbi:MAG: hypothetical protein C7B45_15110 [Sulfobacillus acidophilus]|uniref:Cas12f1-like TNB domain-containing protein n=1 Tax=Sulfobacillus acidophilus TaxID=53633 RepID=A0A2T2WDV8_9FIRM|nr:MAG: hypothetical protein C7B45_15110 [Sulfobacillus acidophilus]
MGGAGLVQATTGKAARAGRQVVLVNSRHTSQDCSMPGCSYRKTDLTLADCTWQCPNDGVWHDRDINAVGTFCNQHWSANTRFSRSLRLRGADREHATTMNREASAVRHGKSSQGQSLIPMDITNSGRKWRKPRPALILRPI